MGKSYPGDTPRIRIDMETDLAGHTTISLNILRPDQSTLNVGLTVEDEANGIVYYDVISTDFNTTGLYHVQPITDFTDGDHFAGETKSFRVYALNE